jgi:hypothetical protein
MLSAAALRAATHEKYSSLVHCHLAHLAANLLLMVLLLPPSHIMDRSLRTPYNPCEFDPSTSQSSSTESSYLPLNATSSDHLAASMAPQLKVQSAPNINQAVTLLPSPSGNDPRSFWGQGHSQVAISHDFSMMQAAQAHKQPSNCAPAAGQIPQDGKEAGGPTATAPFLRDFNLVAEAAKRAQMSIVVRDMESISL